MQQIYHIAWFDASDIGSGWVSLKKIDEMDSAETSMVDTYGFIIKETRQYIIVASSFIDHPTEPQIGHVTRILK